MRWRFEFRDNLDFRSPNDFDFFVGQRLRLTLQARLHSHLRAFVQGEDVWLFGSETDKIGHNLSTNLHQAYLDWKPWGTTNWNLLVGRQEFIYGEERLVGAFNWDNVGRSFDAARLRYRRGAWTNDFFWGRLAKVPRGNLPSRPGNQDLYGVYLTRVSPRGSASTELYGLFLRDGLRTAGERRTAPQTTRVFTLGFRRLVQPKSGWWYGVENAWQFGHRGPDSHGAVALSSKTGYTWTKRWQPALQFEYNFATGDHDPTDGNSNEFNNLFPTNHPFYGYADLEGWRNLHNFRLMAAARLHPKLTVEADYHRFLLASRRGAWKSATGIVLGFDPTGESGRDVGQEVDLTLRLPLHKHFSLLAGYSFFLPGRFAARTRGPETSQFGYIMPTLRF
jgi:hypothetical protein